jgi:putative ATP-dependent endonuclease of OLD family
MLVFSLLTFIADLKGKTSVIFAMEEPEIALPPHTQRRVTRFVLGEMGQAIVTSHSPYVIEQFEPEQIVMLERDRSGCLQGRPIDTSGFKPKAFKTARRQFAEAILSRAVLVVEGATESAIMAAASSVIEATVGPEGYAHLDLAGVSVFDAGGDGKMAFAFFDKPDAPLAEDAAAKLGGYHRHWQSPEKDIEDVLVKEMPVPPLKRFLDLVGPRPDYPKHLGRLPPNAADGDVKKLTWEVLDCRKGDAYGYASLLISQAEGAHELPATIRGVLEAIHQALAPPPARDKGPEGSAHEQRAAATGLELGSSAGAPLSRDEHSDPSGAR